MNDNSDLFTARGICKKLEMSPYKLETMEICLSFSSNTNVKRYHDKVTKYIEEMERKIKRTTGIEVNCKTFAMLKLYKEIEKRGFYVKVCGFVYDNFDDIPFEICC